MDGEWDGVVFATVIRWPQATFYLLTPDAALLSGLTSMVGLCYNSVDWVVSSVSACMPIGIALALAEQRAAGGHRDTKKAA